MYCEGSLVWLSERHSAQLPIPLLGILFAFIFCLFSNLFFLSLSFLQISAPPQFSSSTPICSSPGPPLKSLLSSPPPFMGSTCLSLASLPLVSPINLSPTHSSPSNLKLVLKKLQCSPPHKQVEGPTNSTPWHFGLTLSSSAVSRSPHALLPFPGCGARSPASAPWPTWKTLTHL